MKKYDIKNRVKNYLSNYNNLLFLVFSMAVLVILSVTCIRQLDQVKTLQSKLDESKSQIESLQSDNDSNSHELTRLQENYDDLNQWYDELKQEKDDLSNKYKALKKKYTKPTTAKSKSTSSESSYSSNDTNDTSDDSNSSGGYYVHITETGSKYHSAGCRYLSRSDIVVSIGEAESRGCTPCSVCDP